MANTQHQGTETGDHGEKRLAIIIGLVVLLVGGAVAVHWMISGDQEAGAGLGAKMSNPAGHAPEPLLLATRAGTASANDQVHADIYFDVKSTRLRADAVSVLQERAGIVKTPGMWVVLVQGYADQRGPAEYNRGLAQRRAQSVKQFLIELGVPETSIKVATVGQEGSLCDDPSTECQQLNRRVHVEMRKLTLPAAAAAPVQDGSLTPKETTPSEPPSPETK